MEKTDHQNLPEHVKRRIKISGLFYPMERKIERRWGTALRNGFFAWKEKISDLLDEFPFEQNIQDEEYISWIDPKAGKIECMFFYIKDPASLERIENIFRNIRKLDPFFTYAFVNQVKDGEHCWDIFRFSKFSYFEHCNRVYAPKLKKTKQAD